MTRSINRSLLLSGIALVGLLLSGCPSLSTLQTASTVPAGETRFAVGIEGFGIAVEDASITLPQVEFGVRYGVSDSIDLGGKVYLGGAEAGMKFQYLDGGMDGAIAPAISFMSISTGSGDTSSSLSVLYFHLPFLFGAHMGDMLTLGFGPKFLGILAFGEATSGSDTESAAGTGMMGGGYLQLAMQLGDAFWLAPEFNAYVPMTGDGSFNGVLYQFGLGLMFGGAEPQGAAALPPPPAY